MLSRLLDKALEKLEIKDSAHQSSAKADELLYPTFSFPPSPRGTRSLCARCLTLLSHFITRFGDGTNYQTLVITHSSAIRDMSHAVQMNNTTARKNTSECVICVKTFILFKAMQAHVSFEDSWRSSPSTDWSLTWEVFLASLESTHNRLHVKFFVRHKGGYGWGLSGGFTVCPDLSASEENSERKKNQEDIPGLISLLDAEEEPAEGQSSLDFSSTLSTGTLSLVSSWAKECATSHSKCHRIFGKDRHVQSEAWFPDRLIQVRRKENGVLTARLVLKTNFVNFPPSDSKQLRYLSFSHCWGPPPNPSAPLGGRAGSVLTKTTLPKWTTTLPVNDLPLAFGHAITICAWLNFEYIWIDSLCILQDSKEDWETQSAVMGDVYKFAFLNIAALSSISDYNGFIFSRDTRVAFGLRCSFARILGRRTNEQNENGQNCVLLKGRSRLLWDWTSDIPGNTASKAPLFTRAWVYQERSLARRTLAFATSGVYWSCDEHNLGERHGWQGYTQQGLRTMLHKVSETLTAMSQSGFSEEHGRSLIQAFDIEWGGTVAAYSACKLTKHSDKLIAVSSVARELSNTRILQNKRYLAGFWDVNLVSQLGWITVYGKTTPYRKRLGEEGYSAPSWSWASIEAAVQVLSFLPNTMHIPLADVLAADVELATNFEFGSVKAGWLRLRGILNRVISAETKANYNYEGSSKSTSITDEATGEKLWFNLDTMEGLEIVRRGRARSLVWMPLMMSFDSSLSCSCLVLMEVEGAMYSGNFIRQGEKVYRRLGTGNFGKLATMLKPNDLILTSGIYPNLPESLRVAEGKGRALADGFKRNEKAMQEFVLI